MNAKYLMKYAMRVHKRIVHVNCTRIRVCNSLYFNKDILALPRNAAIQRKSNVDFLFL